jgi:hypothetical protein
MKLHETTRAGIAALVRADKAADARTKARIIAASNSDGNATDQTNKPSAPKVCTRAEAARQLGRSLRLVDSLARRGLLRRVKLPGQQRALGLRADDVQNLVESATVAADDAGKAAA